MLKIKFTAQKREQGFSYLAAMAMIVIIGISLTAIGYQWKTMVKREKEKELLFRGNEIRSAIIQYVNADPLKRYPHSLENLIKDPRSPKGIRYLRKMYKDPVTNGDWEIITDPVRGLVGVHSKSGEKPLKTANFKIQDRCFEGKKHYREWIFAVQPVNPIQPGVILPPASLSGINAGSSLPLALPPCPPTTSSSEDEK